jgi:hypothetical protein
MDENIVREGMSIVLRTYIGPEEYRSCKACNRLKRLAGEARRRQR